MFYLATKGSGGFFGKVGSFKEDYEFDALVIVDSSLNNLKKLSFRRKITKFIYTGNPKNIIKRYLAGRVIEEPINKVKIIYI